VAASAVLIAGAAAQDQPAPNAPEPPASPGAAVPGNPPPEHEKPPLTQARFAQPTWHIEVEPEVWYAAPGGTIRLPGSTATTRPEFFNLDSPRVSPMATVQVRDGDWRLAVSGMTFSEQDRGSVRGGSGEFGGRAFAPGDRVISTLDFSTFQMEAGYRLPVSGLLAGENVPDFFAMWEVVGGVRFIDVNLDMRFPSGPTGVHEFFGNPFVGVRLAMEISHGFSVELAGNIGAIGSGDRLALSDDVIVGLMWRPTPNLGVRVGYRQVAFVLKSGSGAEEFKWDGALAGLHVGAVLRF